MKQEFDTVKALHSLIYDLETTSGQYNIAKMFSECLDRNANAAVRRFREMEISSEYLRTKKTRGSYVRDQWATIDSDQRLFRRFRKTIKERYAHFFDMMLHGEQDMDMTYYVYFSPRAMGEEVAGDFEEELWSKQKWKR